MGHATTTEGSAEAGGKTARASAGQERPSRVIALMNQKGGVGKTTTTVNLAAAIAELGRSVLVIDMDPQAHATLHLGIDPNTLERSVYDVMLECTGDPARDAESTRSALVRTRDRLAVLPAVTDLAAFETELAGAPDRQARLGRAIDCLRAEYEFVLIDCPPSLGLLTLNALAAAREVIVPMQAHFLALQGVGKLLETVHLVSRAVNPRLRVSGVVLCMHDESTNHAREVVADLRGFFEAARAQDVPWRGAVLYQPPIRRNIKLAECPSFGQTIFEYARACPGALDYTRLAQTMVAEWDRVLQRIMPAPGTPGVGGESPRNAAAQPVVAEGARAAAAAGPHA